MKNKTLTLIVYKSYAEIRSEASRSYLGFLWWVLEPLLYLGAFYLIFGIIFERGGPDFVEFLLCGLIFWKLFSSAITVSSNSINSSKGVIQQVYVYKLIFPISAVFSVFLKFIPVFILFLIFIVLTGNEINIHWLETFIVMLIQLTWMASLGILSAILVYYINDIKLLIDNGLLMMFFLSGIFFDIADMPEVYQDYLYLNPMAVFIREYRELLLNQRGLNYEEIIPFGLMGVVILVMSIIIVDRFDKKIGK